MSLFVVYFRNLIREILTAQAKTDTTNATTERVPKVKRGRMDKREGTQEIQVKLFSVCFLLKMNNKNKKCFPVVVDDTIGSFL